MWWSRRGRRHCFGAARCAWLAGMVAVWLLVFDKAVVVGANVEDDWDCSFQDDPLQLMGDLMTLRHVVHPAEKTLTVELTYQDRAWVSLGVNPNGTMMGGEVVIALPDVPPGPINPGKYGMHGNTESSVQLLDAQTLINATFQQTDTATILKYTKLLRENGEITIDPESATTFIFAAGGSNNTFGDHVHWVGRKVVDQLHQCQYRGSSSTNHNNTNQTETTIDSNSTSDGGSPSSAPTTDDDGVGTPPTLGGVLDCSFRRDIELMGGLLTFRHMANPATLTLTVELEYHGLGWLALGTSPQGLMEGGETVIVQPDEPSSSGNPGKYRMTGETTESISLLPLQTLQNASWKQNATDGEWGSTILRFTKQLNETGEHEIVLNGPNTFIYAAGLSNAFGDHGPLKGSFTIASLSRCRPANATNVAGSIDNSEGQVLDSSDQGAASALAVWAAHGLLMAMAWAILVPVGIGASLLRHLRPWTGGGRWFAWHRACNALGALFSLVALVIAIVQTAREGGSHFAGRHAIVGLAIVVGTAVQAVAGICRPHQTQSSLTHAPVERSASSSLSQRDLEDDDLLVGDDDDNDNDHHHKKNENRHLADGACRVDSLGGESKVADSPSGRPVVKSPARRAFEILHRLVGATLVGLAWYNGSTGLQALGQIFVGSSWNQAAWTGVYWGVVGGVSGSVLMIYLLSRRQRALVARTNHDTPGESKPPTK